MILIKKLPTAEEIIEAFPVSNEGYERIVADQVDVRNILNGKDKRFLVIVGPCSAWPYDAVLEYATRLLKLNERLKDKLKIIMRVYIQKPRTAKGWTGPVNQPDPYKAPDIEAGIKYCRSLMIKIIEMGLPIGDECLFTHNSKGFQELLAWVAIGARSSEDQEHRIFASSLDCPVGVKNPTSGSIEIAINSLIAIQNKHTAVFHGYQVETGGNPYAHLVLRGGPDRHNYSLEDFYAAKKFLESNKILNPAIVVDASHDNCKVDGKKDYRQQMEVVRNVLATLKHHPDLQTLVKGFMMESFLKGGCQKIESLNAENIDKNGLSITDPCLGWEETEKILNEIAFFN